MFSSSLSFKNISGFPHKALISGEICSRPHNSLVAFITSGIFVKTTCSANKCDVAPGLFLWGDLACAQMVPTCASLPWAAASPGCADSPGWSRAVSRCPPGEQHARLSGDTHQCVTSQEAFRSPPSPTQEPPRRDTPPSSRWEYPGFMPATHRASWTVTSNTVSSVTSATKP